MSNKDTTELDEILYKHTANYSDWLANNKDFDSNEAREALLLWRDTEVIKTLKKIKKNYGDKFLSPNNKNNVVIIDFDDINAWITQLQSNLKEKE